MAATTSPAQTKNFAATLKQANLETRTKMNKSTTQMMHEKDTPQKRTPARRSRRHHTPLGGGSLSTLFLDPMIAMARVTHDAWMVQEVMAAKQDRYSLLKMLRSAAQAAGTANAEYCCG